MPTKIDKEELGDFFEEYRPLDSKAIIYKIIFTLGLYIIYWLYTTNYEFEKIDKDAPDSKRSIILLLCVPIIWYIVTIIIEKLILSDIPLASDIIKITGWFIFTFLSLQYLYEFCKSYGKITKSSALLWYLFFYPGYYSVILIFFNFYYTIPLIFFPVITVPAMQAYLNKRYIETNLKRIALYFNCMQLKGHNY